MQTVILHPKFQVPCCPTHHETFTRVSLADHTTKRLFCPDCLDITRLRDKNVVSLKEILSPHKVSQLQEMSSKTGIQAITDVKDALDSSQAKIKEIEEHFNKFITYYKDENSQMRALIDVAEGISKTDAKLCNLSEKLHQMITGFTKNPELIQGKELDEYLLSLRKLENWNSAYNQAQSLPILKKLETQMITCQTGIINHLQRSKEAMDRLFRETKLFLGDRYTLLATPKKEPRS